MNTQEATYAEALAAFRKMVEQHDLTFDYSDDHHAYVRGRKQRFDIMEAAQLLPRAEAAHIWNANVDRKIAAGERANWYWKA